MTAPYSSYPSTPYPLLSTPFHFPSAHCQFKQLAPIGSLCLSNGIWLPFSKGSLVCDCTYPTTVLPYYRTTPLPSTLCPLLTSSLSLSLRLHAIFMTDNKTCEHDELPLPLLLHRIVVAWSSTCCLPHTVSNSSSSSRIADRTRQTGLN